MRLPWTLILDFDGTITTRDAEDVRAAMDSYARNFRK